MAAIPMQSSSFFVVKRGSSDSLLMPEPPFPDHLDLSPGESVPDSGLTPPRGALPHFRTVQ